MLVAAFVPLPPMRVWISPLCIAERRIGIMMATEIALRTSAIAQMTRATAPGRAAVRIRCLNASLGAHSALSKSLIFRLAMNAQISPAPLRITPPMMIDTGPAMFANVIKRRADRSFCSCADTLLLLDAMLYPLIPLLPKPDSPRSVSSRESLTSKWAFSTFMITSCAIRSPLSAWKVCWASRFTSVTLSSPR